MKSIEAERTSETVVPSTQIARSYKVTSNAVVKYLARRGICPVAGPSIDGSLRYLYLADALVGIDFSDIMPVSKCKYDPQISLFDEAA
jgi:hypothetical protein